MTRFRFCDVFEMHDIMVLCGIITGVEWDSFIHRYQINDEIVLFEDGRVMLFEDFKWQSISSAIKNSSISKKARNFLRFFQMIKGFFRPDPF